MRKRGLSCSGRSAQPEKRLMGGAGAIGGSRDQLTQFLGAGVPCGKDAGEIGAAVLTGADIPVLIQLYRRGKRGVVGLKANSGKNAGYRKCPLSPRAGKAQGGDLTLSHDFQYLVFHQRMDSGGSGGGSDAAQPERSPGGG